MSSVCACNRNRNPKLQISRAPTKAKSQEPVYSQALNQDKIDRQRSRSRESGTQIVRPFSDAGLFCKITFPGTPNSHDHPMTFFINLPKKFTIFDLKFFSPMTFLSIIWKIAFFPDEFLTVFLVIYHKTISLQPILAIFTRILYILNVSLEKVPVRHD